MKIREIHRLIKSVTATGSEKVELETEGVKIVIKKSTKKKIAEIKRVFKIKNDSPSAFKQEEPLPIQTSKDHDAFSVIVKSPHIGTFRLLNNSEKLLNAGEKVQKGEELCSISSLNIKNVLKSEFTGKIEKILIDDNTPVDFNQPLFLISQLEI